ncbi:Uncharacterised protein [Bordetella pertussis]|nr:Uncharacterised protein [Bordetella pertussis]
MRFFSPPDSTLGALGRSSPENSSRPSADRIDWSSSPGWRCSAIQSNRLMSPCWNWSDTSWAM